MKFLVALNKTAWVIFDGASMKFSVQRGQCIHGIHYPSFTVKCQHAFYSFCMLSHSLLIQEQPKTNTRPTMIDHDHAWTNQDSTKIHPRPKQWHAPLFSFTLLSHKIIEECKLEPHHRPPMHQSKLSTSQPRPKQDPSKTKTIACSTLLFHSSFSQIIEGCKLEHHHQPSMDHHKQYTSQPRLKRCHSSIFFAHIFFDYIWVIQRGV